MRKEQAVSAEEVQEELMNKLMASDYVDYENEMAVKFQQAILMLPEKQRVVFNLRLLLMNWNMKKLAGLRTRRWIR